MIAVTYRAARDIRNMVLPAASHTMFASHMGCAGTLRFEYFTAVLAGKTKNRHIDVIRFGGGGFDTMMVMGSGGGDERT